MEGCTSRPSPYDAARAVHGPLGLPASVPGCRAILSMTPRSKKDWGTSASNTPIYCYLS